MRRLPLILAAAAHPAMPQQEPPPTTGTVPSSRCEGCAAAAILPFHIVSKEFYCHPDGSKVDVSCAAARTPESCCAACLKLNAEKRLCDAWFLNEQGGCFFKNCPPHAWASGECHFDPDVGTPGKYHSGIPDGQFSSAPDGARPSCGRCWAQGWCIWVPAWRTTTGRELRWVWRHCRIGSSGERWGRCARTGWPSRGPGWRATGSRPAAQRGRESRCQHRQ